MAYFECIIGGGGGGESDVNLIVTCSPNFAGKTITCTNGTDTYTQTCPSTSPYTVTFENIAKGTWTVSGVISGQTFSQSVTIADYTAQLNDVPEGSTITPVNDIQIWLHCANIWDKSYTTLNEVLADNTTLLALISSNNAVDYMVRSTSWASSVCSNQTAMGLIGNNNYCANELLANSTWLTAIANSSYIESVCNVKIPTMTSNTTPSGTASATSVFPEGNWAAYKALDGLDSTAWLTGNNVLDATLTYTFPTSKNIKIAKVTIGNVEATYTSTQGTIKIFSGNTEVGSKAFSSRGQVLVFTFPSGLSGATYKVEVIGSNNYYIELSTAQFYGRE